jgi:comEA protein
MHHKYAVIDSTTIITGSHNWSKAANETNDENTLIIKNPVVAAHYEREFERMYQRSFLGPSKKLLAKIQETPTRCPTVTQATEPKAKKKNPESLANQSTRLSPAATTTDQNVVVNVNSADAAELDSLPGIGPTVAAAIVAYRQTNGPFKSLEDLDNVKGIGPKLLEKLQGQLTF